MTRSRRQDLDEGSARPGPRLLLAVVVIAAAWNLIGHLVLTGRWELPANLAVAAALVALARTNGLSWGELGLHRDRIPRGLAVGLAATAVVAAGLAVALLIPAAEAVLEAEAVRPASAFDRWFVPLVRIPLGTAVFEETLFRGVILAELLRRHQPSTAVIASSVLFGLWHILPACRTTDGSPLAVAGAVVGTVAVTALAGLIFAALRLWAHSLMAPILAHTATNSLAYTAALIATDHIG